MAGEVTQQTSGASTVNWDQEKARLEGELANARQQISGLSNERNRYRQNAEAWERVGTELGDRVRRDPATGLPIGVEHGNGTRQPVVNGMHPLAPLSSYVEGFSPAQADEYYQQMYQDQLAKAGYVTTAQAQHMVKEAVQLATANTHLLFGIRDLKANDDYKGLSDYASDLSKKTAQILQERGWAQPLQNAKAWEQWNYGSMDALQLAADLAQLDLQKAKNHAEQATQEAQANQQSAGLSVGQPGATTALPPSGEVPLTKEGGVDFDRLRTETQSRVEQLGIKV